MPTRVKRVQVLKEDNLDSLSYTGSSALPEIKEGKPLSFATTSVTLKLSRTDVQVMSLWDENSCCVPSICSPQGNNGNPLSLRHLEQLSYLHDPSAVCATPVFALTTCTIIVMETCGVLVRRQQHINVILSHGHDAGHREGRMSMDVHNQQHNGHTLQTPLMENASVLKQTAQNGAASAGELSKT